MLKRLLFHRLYAYLPELVAGFFIFEVDDLYQMASYFNFYFLYYYKRKMLRITRFAMRNLNIIKNSLYLCSNLMEPEKELKIIDWKTDTYGDYPFIKSTFRSDRVWTEVKKVNEDLDGQQVLIRARIHTVRQKGNSCFIVLREGYATLQACAFKSESTPKDMIKFMGSIPPESVVDITGKVVKPEKPIESCSQKVELQILKFFVVNRSTNRLPLQLTDASRKVTHNEHDNEEEEQAKEEKKEEKKEEGKQKEAIVKMKTRLDNRVIDIRTPAKHAIFRVNSGVCQLFREYLLERDFVEIHTPKLIGGSSEGGANVFNFSYFNRKACLAQSPQLYKQMCVMGDFQRVFEIGPVFRAENSFTHRHMCEFTGLDLEMAIKEHYFELLDFYSDFFPFIFENLHKRFADELKIINEQFECEPFKCKTPVVRLTFEEGCALLKEHGVDWDPLADLDTATERKLGEIVREKYDTDFYMLHRYPSNFRPFYTTVCDDDPRYSNSYDFFMRGEEILSGAQRIHDPQVLTKRAVECKIDPTTIKDYIECFKYGAYPHGGGGIGLQRVVMLFCGLKNIRNASLFPRDPHRLTP